MILLLYSTLDIGILDQWYLEPCCIWLSYTHSCWLFMEDYSGM